MKKLLFTLLFLLMSAATASAAPCTHWIINHAALTQLVDTFGTEKVERIFAGSCTYVTGNISSQFSAWGMTQSVSTADMRSVSAAARRARVVIYDPEAWQFTPPDQQRSACGRTRPPPDLLSRTL